MSILTSLHAPHPGELMKNIRGNGPRRLLHAFAQGRPRAYLGVVAVTGALGYLYLAAFPVLAVSLLAGLPDTLAAAHTLTDWAVAALKAAGMIGAGWVSYQLAQLTFPAPGIREITPKDAPELFKLIEELRDLHGGPPIHRICLKSDFSLEVVRTPRHGFALGYTNTLLIGLPVLLSLSPRQFQTALSRRTGQLSLTYNRITGLIYYLRQIWKQFRRLALENHAPVHRVLYAFFSWYAPLFSFLSRDAARADEQEADHYALDAATDADLLDMMLAMEIQQRFLEEKFWPAFFATHREGRTPSYTPFAHMAEALRKGFQGKDAERWLNKALAEDSCTAKSTPPLRERLDAIGHTRYRIPAPVDETAASHYLGASLSRFMERMDLEWLRTASPLRNTPRTDAKAERRPQRLEILRRHARTAVLNKREALEYAMLAERYLDPRSAAAVQKELLAKNAADPKLNFVVGRSLLSCSDPEGLKALRTAMALDQRCILPAKRLIANFRALRKTAAS